MTSKQAAELYRRAGSIPPQEIATPDASKYNARKKVVDGHTFDSTGEARAYVFLKMQQDIGAISGLRLQPRYLLQKCSHGVVSRTANKGWRKARDIYYVPDFDFIAGDGVHVVDFKGFQTAAYKIKSKMFQERYPHIIFEEWTRETLRELGAL